MLDPMNPENLVLRPNCLMTRKPLVFVNGARSLFYYEKLGGFLQDYVAAHGYQVLTPVMPFRGPARVLALKNWLARQPDSGFHFVVSSATHTEMHDLLTQNTLNTITRLDDWLETAPAADRPTPGFAYRIHRIFCRMNGAEADPYFESGWNDRDAALYNRFLDRCIELAENEAICET